MRRRRKEGELLMGLIGLLAFLAIAGIFWLITNPRWLLFAVLAPISASCVALIAAATIPGWEERLGLAFIPALLYFLISLAAMSTSLEAGLGVLCAPPRDDRCDVGR